MAGDLNPAAAIVSWTTHKQENTPTTTTITTTTPATADDNKQAGPTLGQKRQRRPSVRLGDIKPLVTTTSTHHPRPKPVFPNSRTRPLTNLDPHPPKRPLTNFTRVQYDDDDEDDPIDDLIHHNNNNNNNNQDDDDEDRRQQQQQHSPVNSVDDDETWPRRSIRSHNNNAGWKGLDDGVRKWLLDLGLSRYAPLFEIHEVDDHVLPHLTLEDLKDMGITAVGSRRKLHTAILNLRKPS